MIVLFGLSLFSLLLGRGAASVDFPNKCKDVDHLDTDTCAQPVEDVVAVTPGSFYTANIRCNDCPYYKWSGDAAHSENNILIGDYDLVRRGSRKSTQYLNAYHTSATTVLQCHTRTRPSDRSSEWRTFLSQAIDHTSTSARNE